MVKQPNSLKGKKYKKQTISFWIGEQKAKTKLLKIAIKCQSFTAK